MIKVELNEDEVSLVTQLLKAMTGKLCEPNTVRVAVAAQSILEKLGSVNLPSAPVPDSAVAAVKSAPTRTKKVKRK